MTWWVKGKHVQSFAIKTIISCPKFLPEKDSWRTDRLPLVSDQLCPPVVPDGAGGAEDEAGRTGVHVDGVLPRRGVVQALNSLVYPYLLLALQHNKYIINQIKKNKTAF